MTSGESRAKTIGSILKFLRNEVGLKQKDIAEKVGIAQQTYAGYESGRHEPSLDLAIRLAEEYGVTLDFIAGRYSDDQHEYEEKQWFFNVLPQIRIQKELEEMTMLFAYEQAYPPPDEMDLA